MEAKDIDLSGEIKKEPYWNRLSLNEDDEAFMNEYRHPIKNNEESPPVEPTPDAYDGYLHMEVGMPRGEDGSSELAVVKRRGVDHLGQPVGIANPNPLLDIREYDIEYSDGTIETSTENLIAENFLSQVRFS